MGLQSPRKEKRFLLSATLDDITDKLSNRQMAMLSQTDGEFKIGSLVWKDNNVLHSVASELEMAADGTITKSDVEFNTVNGRDIEADGAKLDTLHKLTDSEIINAVKNEDGEYSGLDADLLDGKHANEFVATDGNSTIDGNLTTTGSMNADYVSAPTISTYDMTSKEYRANDSYGHSVFDGDLEVRKGIINHDTWHIPTLLNGAYGSVEYKKTVNGVIYLRGDVGAQLEATSIGVTVFILPIGYRPDSDVYSVAFYHPNGLCVVKVTPNGSVLLLSHDGSQGGVLRAGLGSLSFMIAGA
jgi:hypothetical protein